ncbi:MAG: hypothetical protein ACM3NR_04415 [Methanosarcina sp.]
MTGIIDLENNPFTINSWIEQGYPCTFERQERAIKVFRSRDKKDKKRSQISLAT